MAASEKPRDVTLQQEERRNMLGANLNFSVKEAYKQLRTNLEFSLPNINGCRIIGITSSIRSEGKSLTSINLAHTFAETGKNVLLIEGDLRLPSLSRKLMLKKNVGLSNVLVGQADINDAIISYSTKPGDASVSPFFILTAGSTPPNPSELLSSEQMRRLLESLAKSFQYIIVDLPPVTAVTDALAISKYLHGMIVIVRQDHTIKGELAETIHQLEFAHVPILGFVFNVAEGNRKSYKYKYKKRYRYYNSYYSYGYGYGSGYGYGYGNGYGSGYGYGYGNGYGASNTSTSDHASSSKEENSENKAEHHG